MLTAERAHELLRYEADTGRLFRRTARGEREIVGKTAAGYVQLMIDRRACLAHRVIWLLCTGHLPKGQIDHINGDRADNRSANLRDVSQYANMQNMRKQPAGASTGILGASISGHRFRACIRIDGKFKHIGRYDTPEEAHAAYVAVKRLHHEGCTL